MPFHLSARMAASVLYEHVHKLAYTRVYANLEGRAGTAQPEHVLDALRTDTCVDTGQALV